MIIFICVLAGFISPYSWAGSRRINLFVPSDQFEGISEKNSINMREITKNFDSDFRFISAHFREDKDELRLIYGNDLACQGLQTSAHKYKDGAIFYKVVYPTIHDPNFLASMIPSRKPAVRQAMLFDSEKFKDTHGWGYAVFNAQGLTLPGSPEKTNHACFACHSLVEKQNYVFTMKTLGILPSDVFVPVEKTLSRGLKQDEREAKLFKTKVIDFTLLDPELQRIIANGKNKVNIMVGDIMNEEFTGFIAELSYYLYNKTLQSGLPSVAVKDGVDEIMFNYAYVDSDSKHICSAQKKVMRYGAGTFFKKERRKRYTEHFKCF